MKAWIELWTPTKTFVIDGFNVKLERIKIPVLRIRVLGFTFRFENGPETSRFYNTVKNFASGKRTRILDGIPNRLFSSKDHRAKVLKALEYGREVWENEKAQVFVKQLP